MLAPVRAAPCWNVTVLWAWAAPPTSTAANAAAAAARRSRRPAQAATAAMASSVGVPGSGTIENWLL